MFLAGPEERPLISASFDGSAKVWGVETGNMLLDMASHKDAIRAMLVTNKNQLVTASSVKLVNIWNLEDGSLVGTLTGHKKG
jgi:WD40 repeat protein